MTPPRLEIDSAGWIIGITHHVSPNYTSGMIVPSGVQGVIMHTMVGNLPGTDQEFMNGNAQVSAHLGIAQNGDAIQWVDLLGGDVAWAEMAGNYNWYSIEHADGGNPLVPLTQAQINRSAQFVELLSRVGHFPLQEANNVSEDGYGVHYMGGAAWGGHTCPDVPPRRVRSLQRPAILALAAEIRSGGPVGPRTWATKGGLSLAQLCDQQLHEQCATVLRVTVENSLDGEYVQNLANYINEVFAGDSRMISRGIVWYYPLQGKPATWESMGEGSLSDLAVRLHTSPANILRFTAWHSQGSGFPSANAGYINQVFASSTIKLPAGIVLRY